MKWYDASPLNPSSAPPTPTPCSNHRRPRTLHPRETHQQQPPSHTRTLVSDNIFWEEWAGKASTLGGDEPEAPNPMEVPDASIRIMLARMIFKEAQGLSDAKIFEESRYSTPDAAKERKYWW